MTKLREQFRQARRAYESPRYPGDLAADILLHRQPRRPWFFRITVGGTVAAAAAAVVIVNRAATPGGPNVPGVAVAPPDAPGHVRPTPLAYQLPDRMPLALPAAPLVPVTPPVTVSLTALNDLRSPYEGLGPKLRQHLNWSSLMQPISPKPPRPMGPGAATQQAV